MNEEQRRKYGLVYYNPPPWKSHLLATRATLDVIERARTARVGIRSMWEPQGAEEQWLETSIGLLKQIQTIPDGVSMPLELTHAISGVVIAARNINYGDGLLAIAIESLGRAGHGPDYAWLPASVFTDVVIPYRVIDATEWLDYKAAPPYVRQDVREAFEAIWVAREFRAAYDYIDGVVKSGEWTP